MDEIISVLRGDREPQIYQTTLDLDIDELATACENYGYQLLIIDGEAISNKTEFLSAAATALDFPDYFGNNWDAFSDCLTDLDQTDINGSILLYTQPERFAQNAPADWLILVELLQNAIRDLVKTDTPLTVLLKTLSYMPLSASE